MVKLYKELKEYPDWGNYWIFEMDSIGARRLPRFGRTTFPPMGYSQALFDGNDPDSNLQGRVREIVVIRSCKPHPTF